MKKENVCEEVGERDVWLVVRVGSVRRMNIYLTCGIMKKLQYVRDESLLHKQTCAKTQRHSSLELSALHSGFVFSRKKRKGGIQWASSSSVCSSLLRKCIDS